MLGASSTLCASLGRIVEMIELKDHPWFIATQAHPELKSRPNRPHPLFKGFIEAAIKESHIQGRRVKSAVTVQWKLTRQEKMTV